MIRNQPGRFYAILLSTNGPVTGQAGNLSLLVEIDAAGEQSVTGNPPAQEVGPGLYRWNIPASDTDGHELRFEPSHPNPNYHLIGQPSLVIYTRETAVNVGQIAGQDVSATQEVNFDLTDKLGIISAVLSHKVVPTDNGDGSYNLAFRNATDTADLLVLRHNPATGERTVVT